MSISMWNSVMDFWLAMLYRLRAYGRRGLGLSDTTLNGYVDIEVELEDWEITALQIGGLVEIDGNVLTLTDKGNAWLREYCWREMEKHV